MKTLSMWWFRYYRVGNRSFITTSLASFIFEFNVYCGTWKMSKSISLLNLPRKLGVGNVDNLFYEMVKFDYTHINALKFRAHRGGHWLQWWLRPLFHLLSIDIHLNFDIHRSKLNRQVSVHIWKNDRLHSIIVCFIPYGITTLSILAKHTQLMFHRIWWFLASWKNRTPLSCRWQQISAPTSCICNMPVTAIQQPIV